MSETCESMHIFTGLETYLTSAAQGGILNAQFDQFFSLIKVVPDSQSLRYSMLVQ